MNKFKASVYILILLVLANCAAANVLSEKIDAAISAPELANGVQGVMVMSLQSGKMLYERNSNLCQMPASNTKLFTAAAALHLLGPDFTYTTSVYTSGKVKANGTLVGDIVIKGGGDPVLDVADIDAMAIKIRHLGIKKIAGNLIVDDTMFDNIRLGEGWSWDYLPDYYAAETSALNVHRNVVDVYIYPGKKVGPGVGVKLSPVADQMIVKNFAATAPKGSAKTISVSREAFGNVITITGTIAIDDTAVKPVEEIAVKGPQLLAAGVLKTQLAKRGVLVTGKIKQGRLPKGARLITSHKSPPLSQILPMFLKPSHNLIGEMLLKTIGVVMNGKGTAAAGLEAEREFLTGIGIDPSGFSLVDGSGLSRLNLANPRSILRLLVYMNSHRYSRIFLSSLPVAGVDGTLKNRMIDTPAQGNVRAKTGTLRHASCLSGYVTSASREPLAFVIMMNNHADNAAARKAQDEICDVLTTI